MVANDKELKFSYAKVVQEKKSRFEKEVQRNGGLIDWQSHSLMRLSDRVAVAMVQEMRVELQYSPVTSSGTEKTQSGFLPSHQTHNLTPTRSASTAHTLSRPHTIALATMGFTSKIHSAALLLPDIIPLTLFAFNLSPHTQPTRAIMEIQNRASVARAETWP